LAASKNNKEDNMIFGFLKQQFMARRTNDAGEPVHRIWLGDEDETALIDIGSGKLLAHVWHDGYGKYYPTLYVSPFRALQLTLRHQAYLVSLLSLPRCQMDLVRLRSMDDAQGAVQAVLQGGDY
jgi:hypothetical protein